MWVQYPKFGYGPCCQFKQIFRKGVSILTEVSYIVTIALGIIHHWYMYTVWTTKKIKTFLIISKKDKYNCWVKQIYLHKCIQSVPTQTTNHWKIVPYVPYQVHFAYLKPIYSVFPTSLSRLWSICHPILILHLVMSCSPRQSLHTIS